MYRIGEFSYLCKTTIKTLRHYDKINLLKPIEIDNQTGYRYYNEGQIEEFTKIKNLQTAGFKLTEIKNLLNNLNQEKINAQLEKINEEYSKKIDILNNMKKIDKQNTPRLITNPKYQAIGKIITLNNRKEIPNIINHFPVEIKHLKTIFISFEKGYKEENIKAFIGKILDEKLSTNYALITSFLNQGYIHYNDDKVPTYLYLKTKNPIEGYQEIIKYAANSNIELRGPFQEITNENETDIHIEAYDLTIENQDTINFLATKKEYLKNINNHPEEFIGTWYLQGEIIELPNQVNYQEEHYLPDTKYQKLELHKDGSTNFENITWKDKYLIIKEADFEYYSILQTPKQVKDETYMEILMNQKATNSRPYLYYYKKGKNNEKI